MLLASKLSEIPREKIEECTSFIAGVNCISKVASTMGYDWLAFTLEVMIVNTFTYDLSVGFCPDIKSMQETTATIVSLAGVSPEDLETMHRTSVEVAKDVLCELRERKAS